MTYVPATVEDITAALGPVVRDLTATCAVAPVVRPSEGDEEPGVWLLAPDGTGRSVGSVLWSPDRAEQSAELADQAQEWAVEALWGAGRAAVWPECPEHPDAHPLSPGTRAGTAVWSCPRSRQVVAEIGRLAPVSP
ncbi:hypothetical protein [Streptomyces sp. NBC_01304]|uniref:hypothetical protein n=1 Tax=Streptomyces sp. NBC_01304 TaxID=2903818 RepID=UPI002E11A996|nr:hypothetical protein OG430_36010 [Streptomyces sp. NBC_01304]